jgi:F0F1-type ATP synthase gamma subunit
MSICLLFFGLLVDGFVKTFQVSVLADDILKNVEFDALRIVYNKFQSVVSFIPTISTILSPEVRGTYISPPYQQVEITKTIATKYLCPVIGSRKGIRSWRKTG